MTTVPAETLETLSPRAHARCSAGSAVSRVDQTIDSGERAVAVVRLSRRTPAGPEDDGVQNHEPAECRAPVAATRGEP